MKYTLMLATLLVASICHSDEVRELDAVAGELAVIEAPKAEQARWLVSRGYGQKVIYAGNKLATVPTRSGRFEFIYVVLIDGEIKFIRHALRVSQELKHEDPPPPPPPSPSDPPEPIENTLRPSAKEVPGKPVVVLYTMNPCPQCTLWKNNELPRFTGTDWVFAEIGDQPEGVSRFPSFEIRAANGRRRYVEGVYLTKERIESIRRELEEGSVEDDPELKDLL